MTKEEQDTVVRELTLELETYIALEDEYHAEQVRKELMVAQSLARLIHKA